MSEIIFHGVWCYDVDFENFVPELPHNFYRSINVEVGHKSLATKSTFSVTVCSFTWLAHHYSNEGPQWGRHLLLVGQYNAEEIRKAITERVLQCSRPTWEKSLEMLCRYFIWEFEDYVP
ncbi:Imm8 family immunity protein [Amphibiibacter pelophylacis]|uniref:Imm8 family immunity protein n=1 Tax=Amphibiibacter pelophylacis TaxID=1799477 RepID=A0ACC6P4L3_9BURK